MEGGQLSVPGMNPEAATPPAGSAMESLLLEVRRGRFVRWSAKTAASSSAAEGLGRLPATIAQTIRPVTGMAIPVSTKASTVTPVVGPTVAVMCAAITRSASGNLTCLPSQDRGMDKDEREAS